MLSGRCLTFPVFLLSLPLPLLLLVAVPLPLLLLLLLLPLPRLLLPSAMLRMRLAWLSSTAKMPS